MVYSSSAVMKCDGVETNYRRNFVAEPTEGTLEVRAFNTDVGRPWYSSIRNTET